MKKEEEVAKKLYVGNLPYEVTNSQLEELFVKAGTVESVNIITDSFSGRSKGFGFIEMSTDEEAMKAMKMFNGYELSGRTIVVNEARPKPEYRGRDSYRSYTDHPRPWQDRGRGRDGRRRNNRDRKR